MSVKWQYEYAPKFKAKATSLRSPLAVNKLESLCKWIASQLNPDKIPNCETCEEKITQKLYFVEYGWHIVFRFDNDKVIFLMFYNAPDGMIK